MSGFDFFLPTLLVLLPLVIVAALTGVLLAARTQSMLPDALSHSVLPGIIVAVWLSGGSISPLVILGGAVVASLLALWATNALETHAAVSRPVALACVYPAMLSLGLVLNPILGLDSVGFDVHNVFFGSIDFLFWPEAMGFFTLNSDQWHLALQTAPAAFLLTLTALTLLIGLLTVYRGHLNALLFDIEFAELVLSQPQRMLFEASFVLIVTLAAVASFLSVGAIMAVALFSAPALLGRVSAHSLAAWFIISALTSLCTALISFSGLVLLPEVVLPALDLSPQPLVLGISLAGGYAVIATTAALATLMKKRNL